MFKAIDDFLNGITMYRLVLYVLLILLGLAIILSFLDLLSFAPLPLIFTTATLVAVSYLTNQILAKVFGAFVNFESIFITALILSLIINPINSVNDLPVLFLIAILAPAAKFFLAVSHKHIFNPAAFAVTLVFLFTTFGPSWWVGEPVMLIPTVLGGSLIVRKLKRWNLVLSFLLIFSLTTTAVSFLRGIDLTILPTIFLSNSLILFFAFIMLTEPQTTPPTRGLQIIYGGLVGLIFSSNLHIGQFYTTPEMSLIIGNIFSFLVSPKEKLILPFLKKIKYSSNLYDFVFKLDRQLNFLPGQFMELTLPLKNLDSRGNRRYFTLASSPTEWSLRIGVRFSENSSAFKKQLLEMIPGEKIVVSSLSGDFILPKDPNQKLVFIAGGIGITPFRCMVKYLIDQKQKRDVVLFYSVKIAADAIYLDIFNQAKELGVKTIVKATDQTGIITKEMITAQVPDFKDRLFYLSGPHAMVEAFKKTLSEMNIPGSQIKTDYFPGYA